MFDELARWVYGAHWRGWVAKAAATVVYMLAAHGFQEVTGLQVRHEAAAMWRGYYLFDTAKDIALNDDPWYDHALDTGIPWVLSWGFEGMVDNANREGIERVGRDVAARGARAMQEKRDEAAERTREGGIVAYRWWWNHYYCQNFRQPHLHSTYVNYCWRGPVVHNWGPPRPLASGRELMNDGRRMSRFGFFAWRNAISPDWMLTKLDLGLPDEFKRLHTTFGEVMLWGRVYEHEHGYRAQNAMVRKLYVFPEAAAIVKSLEQLYQCEVEICQP